MKHTVHIVNGPNLNLLGQREPDKYGHTSFEAYFESLRAAFPEVQLSYFQSNVEGELIDHLHAIGFEGAVWETTHNDTSAHVVLLVEVTRNARAACWPFP